MKAHSSLSRSEISGTPAAPTTGHRADLCSADTPPCENGFAGHEVQRLICRYSTLPDGPQQSRSGAKPRGPNLLQTSSKEAKLVATTNAEDPSVSDLLQHSSQLDLELNPRKLKISPVPHCSQDVFQTISARDYWDLLHPDRNNHRRSISLNSFIPTLIHANIWIYFHTKKKPHLILMEHHQASSDMTVLKTPSKSGGTVTVQSSGPDAERKKEKNRRWQNFCWLFFKKKKKGKRNRKGFFWTLGFMFCITGLLFPISASWNVFGFALPLEARVGRVEALLLSSEQGPAGSLGHVVQGGEAPLPSCLLVKADELLETLVVDPCPPLAVHFELKRRQKSSAEEPVKSSQLWNETLLKEKWALKHLKQLGKGEIQSDWGCF